MGVRRIRLCKGCGKKFTPMNQRPAGLSRQEAEERAEGGSESQESQKAPPESEMTAEPARALSTVFPPPDQEWTS